MTREPKNGGLGIELSEATSLRRVSIGASSVLILVLATRRSRSGGRAAPSSPRFTAMIESIKRKPSKASRA